MNTGIQRSSATPFGASTTTSPAGKLIPGQVTWKKNMPEIAAAHDIPYVATACPSYPIDLVEKVKKGARVKGPAYVHILSVCPTGWRLPPELSIKAGRLAVETGVFPLYEVEHGRYKLTIDTGKLRPVKDYLKIQGRFRHLDEAMIAKIQQRVVEEYERLKKKVKMTQGD
jgi:pyruvate ferredoxin oxidoreductase beta subunit